MGRAPSVSLSISSPTRADLENLKRLLLQASRYCRHLDWLICSDPPPSTLLLTVRSLSSRSYVTKTSNPGGDTKESFFSFSSEKNEAGCQSLDPLCGGSARVLAQVKIWAPLLICSLEPHDCF